MSIMPTREDMEYQRGFETGAALSVDLRKEIERLRAEVARLQRTNHLEIVLPPFGEGITIPFAELNMDALKWMQSNCVIVMRDRHDVSDTPRVQEDKP